MNELSCFGSRLFWVQVLVPPCLTLLILDKFFPISELWAPDMLMGLCCVLSSGFAGRQSKQTCKPLSTALSSAPNPPAPHHCPWDILLSIVTQIELVTDLFEISLAHRKGNCCQPGFACHPRKTVDSEFFHSVDFWLNLPSPMTRKGVSLIIAVHTVENG